MLGGVVIGFLTGLALAMAMAWNALMHIIHGNVAIMVTERIRIASGDATRLVMVIPDGACLLKALNQANASVSRVPAHACKPAVRKQDRVCPPVCRDVRFPSRVAQGCQERHEVYDPQDVDGKVFCAEGPRVLSYSRGVSECGRDARCEPVRVEGDCRTCVPSVVHDGSAPVRGAQDVSVIHVASIADHNVPSSVLAESADSQVGASMCVHMNDC